MLTAGPRRAVSAILAIALCGVLTASPAGAIGVTSTGHATRNPIGLVGDFDGDREADIAIGVPKEDVGSVVDAGAVNVLYGSGGGLASDGNQFWNQDSAGILDQSATGDQFGSAVAVGDFNATDSPTWRSARRSSPWARRLRPERSTCCTARWRWGSPRPATSSGPRTAPAWPGPRKPETTSGSPLPWGT